MVPKQVSYRFPGIDYCTVSIQRGKVPIPTHYYTFNGGFILYYRFCQWKPYISKMFSFQESNSITT